MSEKVWQIEVFYDGQCPLCTREIRFLQAKDRGNAIRFTDIADPEFEHSAFFSETGPAIALEKLNARIHGRLPDGSIIEGVEVFRRLYTAIGWKVAVWISRLPIVKTLLDVTYQLFAKNRLRLTGRCRSNFAQQCVVEKKS